MSEEDASQISNRSVRNKRQRMQCITGYVAGQTDSECEWQLNQSVGVSCGLRERIGAIAKSKTQISRKYLSSPNLRTSRFKLHFSRSADLFIALLEQ